jgi:uncharacterized repeat protein (TIGR03943 family)
MENRSRASKAPVLTAFVAWAAFFIFVLATGRVRMYIGPRFIFLPAAGAVILTAMVMALLKSPGRVAGHGDATGRWDWVPLFVTPVVIGILVAPIGVGTIVAGNRKTNLMGGVRQSGSLSFALGASSDYREVTVYDLATAASITPGKVSVKGQILERLPGMAANQCPLAHYKMTCCVADLQPVAVTLEYPAGFTPQANQWVSVRGTVRREGDATIVKADIVAPISAPNPPYLY